MASNKPLSKLGYTKCYSVPDLINDKKKATWPHKGPILYCWWFPKGSDIVTFIENQPEINKSEIASMKKGNTEYFALYLGKGANGRRRLGNHLRSNKRYSTLRRTIAAILGNSNEDFITDQLAQCYYEWCELPGYGKAQLAKSEEREINDGYFPLNVMENKSVDSKWIDRLKEMRKRMKE